MDSSIMTSLVKQTQRSKQMKNAISWIKWNVSGLAIGAGMMFVGFKLFM